MCWKSVGMCVESVCVCVCLRCLMVVWMFVNCMGMCVCANVTHMQINYEQFVNMLEMVECIVSDDLCIVCDSL